MRKEANKDMEDERIKAALKDILTRVDTMKEWSNKSSDMFAKCAPNELDNIHIKLERLLTYGF